ncbi:hypothetical protein DUNSADRAFT_4452 [Dunaliella salina]|uniref:Encoded protein n=1 Tax=Dunaliella salina TaxID=3046 RepID=A0ABQ7GS32_DUNSA|nr:hypothetical protein DUNSADRAFT_4452 [Dunaliella salina]|eukprot:KAF5837404.1 hypothetical protein DUNSADRAFT_4452 [Dunaliella salina]
MNREFTPKKAACLPLQDRRKCKKKGWSNDSPMNLQRESRGRLWCPHQTMQGEHDWSNDSPMHLQLASKGRTWCPLLALVRSVQKGFSQDPHRPAQGKQ